MNVQAAVRRGIPLNRLVARMLLPAVIILAAGGSVHSFQTFRQVRNEALKDILTTVQTVYDTHPAVHGEANGLSVLNQSRDFERFWILSATGDILASSRRQEVGAQLDRAWWKHLEGRSTGVVVEEVPFGSRTLLLAGVYNSDQGRWAVALTDRPHSNMASVWAVVGILSLSLIILSILGVSIRVTMGRNLATPLARLDETAGELLRGSVVSEATLDRLWAETSPALGGHADGFVDLARSLLVTRRRGDESESRFQRLFESLDGLVFIRSRDARILAVNGELRSRIGLSKEWALGNSVFILSKFVPVAALEEWLKHASSGSIGIRRLEVFPGDMSGVDTPIRVSAIPIQYRGDEAHLILIEPISADYSAMSDRTDPRRVNEGGDGASETDVNLSPGIRFQGLQQAVLQASDEIVVVLDEQARVVYWSPAAERITGKFANEVCSLRDFVDNVLQNDSRTYFDDWLDREPTRQDMRLGIITAEGIPRSTIWKAVDIKLDDGVSLGILVGRVDNEYHREPGDDEDDSRSELNLFPVRDESDGHGTDGC